MEIVATALPQLMIKERRSERPRTEDGSCSENAAADGQLQVVVQRLGFLEAKHKPVAPRAMGTQ